MELDLNTQPVIIIRISLFSEDFILTTGTYLTYGPLEHKIIG